LSQAILVVEDDEHIRHLVRTVLTREGHEVISAHNGVSALAEIERHSPGLIILDMHMPQMNGNDFLDVYHTMQRRVPVIIITVDPLSVSNHVEAAVGKVLIKPFTVDELLDCVREFLPRGVAP
jgi:DNA-binding response OmpR family regulator